MNFRSLTTWIADEFEVTVRAGAFPTEAMAMLFGSRLVHRILVAGPRAFLIDCRGRLLSPILDEDVSIRRLTDPTVLRTFRLSTGNDYEDISIPIRDWWAWAPLLSLECVGFGFEAVHAQVGGAKK